MLGVTWGPFFSMLLLLLPFKRSNSIYVSVISIPGIIFVRSAAAIFLQNSWPSNASVTVVLFS